MRQHFAAALLFLGLVAAPAQTTTFTYQGQLLVSGSPHTGSAEFQFTVWDAASGGTQLAATTPAITAANVTNGLFAASLDFGAAVFTGADRWLDVQVRTGLGAFTPLGTRQRLTATPYAIRAREAAAVPNGSITGSMIANGAVGDAQISTIAEAGTVANTATSATSANTSNTIVVRDGSGRFFAGGVSIEGGSTVGAFHVTGIRDGFFATPVGLIENFNGTGSSGPALRLVTYGGDSVDGVLSVSSTGAGFLATFGNASGFVSRLTTNGIWRARAYEATDYLKAGFNHELTGSLSSVTGGINNTNRASRSVIGGGEANIAGAGSSAVTLGGGSLNTVGTNAHYATIAGGRLNQVADNAVAATVPGGWDNRATGDNSFAAGRFARATHGGAFVWSDANGSPFFSTATNQFSVKASGGARFETLGAGMTLDGLPVVAGLVGDSSLANDSVSSFKIVDGSVGTQDLADGAVNFNKLFNNSVTSAKIVDGSVQAADLDAASFDTTFWRTAGNTGTTPGTHFLGTADNQPLELKVNNQRVLRLEYPTVGSVPNLVGGFSGNSVGAGTEGAVIAGGGEFGFTNSIGVNADWSAIGGGALNTIASSSFNATIAGGVDNDIGVNSDYSAIGGGAGNTIASDSLDATIAGGQFNDIGVNADWSAIGGGYDNNIASNSLYAVIPGGRENAVGAGATNAFAAGYRAKANHAGAFVWADFQNADFPSTFTNQFRVRASGGMDVVGGTNTTEVFKFSGSRTGDIFTPLALGENRNTSGNSAPALRLVNHGGNSVNGVLSVSTLGVGNLATFGNASTFVSILTTNGTWSALAFNPTSDRTAKENFTAVDPRDVLDKVAALPLARWNYKAAPGLDHIGPVAQDFHAAFGLNGEDDKHIATVDADGVALAAIQGLNQKVDVGSQKAESRMRNLEVENAELRQELSALRRLLERRLGLTSTAPAGAIAGP